MKFKIFNLAIMKKFFLYTSVLLLFSCNQFEDCGGIEIIDGLVYKNGELYTAKCAFYDDNSGKMISSHQYKEGKFSGKWKFYYPNGQVQTVGKFDDEGNRNGKWNYYFDNGQLNQIAYYANGKKDGFWKVYNEKGDVIIEQEWDNGNMVVDTTQSPKIELKIEGYDVKPIKID